ncbi:YmfP protein [Escherichia coli]|nr:YmfP protein [Escherichia coli]
MRQDIEASVIGGLLIGGLTPTASDVLATLEPEAFSIPLYRHWMGTGTVGVMIASSDLINPIPEESTETAARQHIGPLAPVAGSDLYVFRPVAHTVDFHIRVTPDTPEIRAAITAELRSFLLRDGYPQGELKVSRISEAISGANGEYSHQLLAPAENISIAKNELAVLGTISWT